MINIATLQKLVNFSDEDEAVILRHRAALNQQVDELNRRFSRWFVDEAGWPADDLVVVLPGFLESILQGRYEKEFISQQYHQALYWYRHGMDATTSIAASSHLRTLLHEACFGIEQDRLARAICKVVDLSQAVLSVVHHIASTHQRLQHNTEAEISRVEEIAKSFSDDFPNQMVNAYIEHLNWKLRAYSLALGNKLDTHRSLELSTDECVLGRWLNDGGMMAISEEVRSGFVSAHNRLHEVARQILLLEEASEPENMVDYLLDMDSASREVMLILGEHIEREIRKLVTIDSLTRIGNRRSFVSELKRKMEESQRTKVGFGLLFFDIDHFKAVNDRFGHSVGDEVLKSVADRLMKALRSSDVAYRWGGEEFVVLVSTANTKGVANVSERILFAMNSTPVISSAGLIKITVSIGYTYNQSDSLVSIDELVAHADSAMLKAKAHGRNRIICYCNETDPDTIVSQELK